ncbi:MAG: ABC transporter substrate-binding protein, partial [Lachnospiraceae bacterium]|nr:ABC transporter substrate-binding protein [Lachnospiraceae bacterium]
MWKRIGIITLCCLVGVGLLWLGGCSSPSSEVWTVELEKTGSMDLQYAENFTVDYFEGGYTLLTV